MPSSCVVTDCHTKYSHAENISYHKFPHKSPALLKEWVRFTGRGALWRPSQWSAICSRHFRATDFKECPFRKNLVSSAVPSVCSKAAQQMATEEAAAEEAPVAEDEYQQDDLGEEELLGDEFQLMELMCRTCGVAFSRNSERLLNDMAPHAGEVIKCLPFVNLELFNYPQKICVHCLKFIEGFSRFYDTVAKAQVDLEQRFTRNLENLHNGSEQSGPEIAVRALKIKQEPLINIKEEKVEAINSGRPREPSVSEAQIENTIILNKPMIANDNSRFILLNATSAGSDAKCSTGKQQRESSKNCEILEIVNLHPPIVDITSTTITEVQPYENTLPLGTFQTYSPQVIKGLKVENTAEHDDYEEYFAHNEPIMAVLKTLEEHSYSKLPIQGDDNKDYVFRRLPQTFVDGTVIYKTVRAARPAQVCFDCGHKSSTPRRLLHHRVFACNLRKRHFRCRFCVKRFPAWAALRSHVVICRKRVARWERLRQRLAPTKGHIPDTATESKGGPPEARFTCTMCERSYGSASSLRRHTITHRPMDQWNHKCGVCLKIFDKLFDLKKHFQMAMCNGGTGESGYQLDTSDTANPAAAERLLYVCSSCSKQFKSYNSLKVHESIHTGLKAYICETCGKSFSGQTNLCQHRLTHSELRQFQCKLCPKIFKRSGGLRQHVKTFHMQIKPYRCPVCQRDFALKADMTRCRHSKLRGSY